MSRYGPLHNSTGLVILQHLARKELLKTQMTTFMVPRFPQPVHTRDIKEAFIALADAAGFNAKAMLFSYNHGIEVYCPERLFEKLFKVIFILEKLYPVQRSERVEGHMGPLPTLFIGNEKTQVRQIPLTETPPWPFRFLLELGGMIVCRPKDERDFILELKQYLNNHPQFRIKVDAKKWDDGSIVVFTYWFEVLPKKLKKGNVNVPSRTGELPETSRAES